MAQTLTKRFPGLDRNVFLTLWAAGLLGVVAVLPYAMDLVGSLPVDRTTAPDMPMPLVVGLALLQNGILLAVAIAIGLVLAGRIGLRLTLIRSWVAGQRPLAPKGVIVPGLLLGGVAGAVLVAVDGVFFLRHLPETMRQTFDIPLWKRLLAGIVYGGITEELLMRLFLLSLVAWLLGRWWKTSDGLPTAGAFWTAIVVVAILFGLGHLPITSAVASLTPHLVARALALNGLAGVAFGYLYWKHGLEAAIAGHMSAHVVMQVPGVMLLRTMQ